MVISGRPHYKFLARLIAKSLQVCVVSRSYSVLYVQEIVEHYIHPSLLFKIYYIIIFIDFFLHILKRIEPYLEWIPAPPAR